MNPLPVSEYNSATVTIDGHGKVGWNMRKLSILVLGLAVVAMWTASSFAEEGKHMFVGASKCKMCHKKAAAGEQFVKWEASPHAKAFATLGTDEANAISEKLGFGKAAEAKECLRCHVTGYGAAAELLGPKYAKEEGVGCESCHGAGGDYIKKATMKDVTMGKIEPASVGLVIPTKDTCLGCHNDKSPTFAGFDYDKYLAKIAHNMPAEYKAAAKAGTTGGDEGE